MSNPFRRPARTSSCATPNCTDHCREGQLMCPRHWHQVPDDIKADLQAAWQCGNNREHLRLRQVAIDHVVALEAQAGPRPRLYSVWKNTLSLPNIVTDRDPDLGLSRTRVIDPLTHQGTVTYRITPPGVEYSFATNAKPDERQQVLERVLDVLLVIPSCCDVLRAREESLQRQRQHLDKCGAFSKGVCQ